MKSTSLLVLLFYFLCASAMAAVKGAPALASEGIFAAFGSSPLTSSDIIRENKFDFMTIEIARKLGVSKTEMESYNREVDQLNEMMSEVSHELAEMKGPTIDDAISLWSGLKGAVSTSTLEALHKITHKKK